MYKVGLFQGSEESGPAVLPLFGPCDSYFEKTASISLLPDVSSYIAGLKPRNDSQYALVTAMGAGEYYGSNVNGDRFSEASLIHRPDNWKGIPSVDAVLAKRWPYGFPTFYNARVFPHHRNKDPNKSLGSVELAAWNPHMKRVELVTRLDIGICKINGGSSIWDRLKAGDFPDLSMGSKVPFDTCSVCTDREAYRKAWETFDPKRHRCPGDAILEVHKALISKGGKGIRGLSITRADYCDHARYQMNKILPSGVKVYVDNDFPNFFDISYVFVGADKIAKAMLKIADSGRVYSIGSAEFAEKVSSEDTGIDGLLSKMAAAPDEKSAEIVKKVVPNQLAGKAVPLLTASEKDLPNDVLDLLGSSGMPSSLATATGLGIVLKPREFQRIILVCGGRKDLADDFDRNGLVCPVGGGESEDSPFSHSAFSPLLAKVLASFLGGRSAFGPHIEHRVLVMSGEGSNSPKTASCSHATPLLRKIGAYYNGYRTRLMDNIPHAQDALSSSNDGELSKLASVDPNELFTPLAYQYLATAHLNEGGRYGQSVVKVASQAATGVPSR